MTTDDKAMHTADGDESGNQQIGTLDAIGVGLENQSTRIVERLEKFVVDATTLMAAIETASTNAEEAAKNAKSAQAELAVTLSSISDVLTKANSEFDAIKATNESARQLRTQSEALTAQIEQNAELAKTRSQHVEEGKVYINEKRAEIDRLLTDATKRNTDIEGAEKSARSTVETINTLNSAAQGAKITIDEMSKNVATILDEAKKHAETTRGLADVASTTETRVAGFEENLRQLGKRAEEQLQKITDLLPGATSAGLASAFQARRKSFFAPYFFWQALFLLSLGGLATITTLEFSLLAQTGSEFTLERIGIGILRRLPMALPLIWLALHSGRKAALAQRVEEDYGFKETVSRSFEGYRKEMVELESSATENSAVRELCNSVLRTISERPGRIYDGHPLMHTPTSEVAALGPVISAIVAATVTQTIKQLKPSLLDTPNT